MAKNTIADLDTTSANNTDILGQSTAGSALANTIDTIVQNSLAVQARAYADYGGLGTVGGSANAITLTSASTYQLLESGLQITVKATAANTTAATLNLDSLGARAIRLKGDVALTGGEIAANGIYNFTYDAAYNAAAGAWVLMNPETKGVSGLTTTDNAVLRADGTAGRAQNSAFIVDDSGNVSSFGGNIKFPATDVPSADVNTLDDYEEGTFTPAFSASGSTFVYAVQYGSYTKVGNRVYGNIFLQLSTGNTLSANPLTITGLPFASGESQICYFSPRWAGSTTSYVNMAASLASGASTLTISGLTAAGINFSVQNANAALNSNGAIGVNFSYKV